VVDDGDSYRAAYGGELFGDGAIFGRGGGVSGGVVVDQDDGGRTLGDGGAEYFARVDQGRVQDASGDENFPDHAVAGRQEESVELFLWEVAEAWFHTIEHVSRATHAISRVTDFRTRSPA